MICTEGSPLLKSYAPPLVLLLVLVIPAAIVFAVVPQQESLELMRKELKKEGLAQPGG